MAVFNAQASFGGGAGEVYSTEETVIGTWIDGKPLYRRVHQVTTPSEAANPYGFTDIPIPNTWENIRPYGFLSDKYNYYMSIPSVWNATTQGIGLAAAPGAYLYMTVFHGNFFNRPATIILEYTKTTD